MQPNYADARKRSIDNLQRLYTVVVSLAFTESLRRTLLSNGEVELNWSNKWVMFLSLVVTVIPFYHGANRYLDATYVTGERTAKRYSLMVDFLFLLFQGLLLFTLALFITNDSVLITSSGRKFFQGLALLLFIDIVWVQITRWITSDDIVSHAVSTKIYTWWAVVNIAAIALILLCVRYQWGNWLLPIAILRSVIDYLIVHDFYYPPNP